MDTRLPVEVKCISGEDRHHGGRHQLELKHTGRNATEGRRASIVELSDGQRGILKELSSRLPGAIHLVIASSVDEILELATIDAGIDNVVNLILGHPIGDIRRQRRWRTLRAEGRRNIGEEKGFVKDRMDSLPCLGKMEVGAEDDG